MKSIFIVMLSFFLISFMGIAQEEMEPTKVVKAAIFDKSPPLRDMEIIEPYPLDNSWKEGIIENETVEYGSNKGQENTTDPLSLQSKMGSRSVKGPIVNIEGTGNVNGVYPPDTDGDVGPDHYMQMINLSFAVYDKMGNKLYGPVANSTLWSGFPGPWQGTNDGDPIIMYDDMADRWVASQFAVWTSNNKFYELVAVSETGDPLGSWYRYAFEFDDFPDYPKLSVWSDAYLATFHMFNSSLTQFLGTSFVAFEREKMLIGDPDAQMVYYGEFGSLFGFQPVDADGPEPPEDTPGLFFGINFFGNQGIQVRQIEIDWEDPSNSILSTAANITPPTFNNSINGIPQPGTGTQLAAFGNNVMYRVPYRNYGDFQSMAANHTVRVGNTMGIRWYELRNEGTGWELYQSGTYQPDSDNRWMGSIALGADTSIALGYSVSSSSVYPSVRYTGRTADAPLGEMNIEEVEIVAGLSSQSGIERWGDYASMTADPTEEGVFWFTTEYMKSSGWSTRIASFNFDDLQQPVVNAGPDDTVCVNSLYEANNATGLYFNSVEWVTTGDGIFQNPNVLNAKYLRGDGDIENGGVTLILTGFGYNAGWEAVDSIYVSIINEPEVFAGNDTTFHFNNNLFLITATAENTDSVMWTTSGDGTFTDPMAVNTSYIPGNDDVLNGTVTLTLTGYAVAPCEEEDSDVINVTIDPTVGVDALAIGNEPVRLYPNPTEGTVEIRFSDLNSDNLDIRLSNMLGTTVYELENITSGQPAPSLDLTGLPRGLYILEIKGENINISEKILKK